MSSGDGLGSNPSLHGDSAASGGDGKVGNESDDRREFHNQSGSDLHSNSNSKSHHPKTDSQGASTAGYSQNR